MKIEIVVEDGNEAVDTFKLTPGDNLHSDGVEVNTDVRYGEYRNRVVKWTERTITWTEMEPA